MLCNDRIEENEIEMKTETMNHLQVLISSVFIVSKFMLSSLILLIEEVHYTMLCNGRIEENEIEMKTETMRDRDILIIISSILIISQSLLSSLSLNLFCPHSLLSYHYITSRNELLQLIALDKDEETMRDNERQ